MKLKTRMTIGRPVGDVWSFVTTPEYWARWWGGTLKEVRPGWEPGGQLIWETGQPSIIKSISPLKEVVISSRWAIRRWTFKDLKGAVLLEIEEEFIETLPSSEAQWRDDWQSMLTKLKQSLEAVPSGAEDNSKKRPWWKLW